VAATSVVEERGGEERVVKRVKEREREWRSLQHRVGVNGTDLYREREREYNVERERERANGRESKGRTKAEETRPFDVPSDYEESEIVRLFDLPATRLLADMYSRV
jgi:hypothetical protein